MATRSSTKKNSRNATGGRRVKTRSAAVPRAYHSTPGVYGRQTAAGVRPVMGVQYTIAGTNRRLTQRQVNGTVKNIEAARAFNIQRAVAVGVVLSPVGGAAAYALGKRSMSRQIQRELGMGAAVYRGTTKINSRGQFGKTKVKRIAGARGGAARAQARRHYERDARGRFK